MKNKYTIAYIGAIIAIPVALLFIVPAVATTNAFNWNNGSDAQSSFAEAQANALGEANTWSQGDASFASAETDSDALAHANATGVGATADADAHTDGQALSWTHNNESGQTSGGAYASNSGSASAWASADAGSCDDTEVVVDEEVDHSHDCTGDCNHDYNWCDDHDCTDNHDHGCTWGCNNEEEVPAPTCTLDIAPNSIVDGNEALLTWETSNATEVTISGIGAASLDGEEAVYPHSTQTYTLTAVGEGGTVTCSDTVGVIADEGNNTTTNTSTTTYTNVNNNYNYNYNTYSGGGSSYYEKNVSCDAFSVSDSHVEEGDTVTLTWRTSDADDVDINNGVGDVSDDGSEEVTVNKDTTFTLTARNSRSTDTCRVNVKVDEDTTTNNNNSNLRCVLTVSDDSIAVGESAILSWVNYATDRLVLKDNTGKVLADSKKDSSIDEDVDALTVKPLKDTKYTLDVYKGSKKETCTVNVAVGKKGMVQGISLSQVPYTGFEAGPMLTALFYAAIALWGLVLAYALVLKKKNSQTLSK